MGRSLIGVRYCKAGDVKSGRGGPALLVGLLACARWGRRLSIAYRGRAPRQTVYRRNILDLIGAEARCMTFGGSRVEAAIVGELLRAVQPMATLRCVSNVRVIQSHGYNYSGTALVRCRAPFS